MLIISLISIIFIVIIIHELGHLWIAKLMGIKLIECTIGFGPTLLSFYLRGIKYKISYILLGVYLKFDRGTSRESKDIIYQLLKKIAIIIAGPIANIIFAFLLCCLLQYKIIYKKKFIMDILPSSIAASKDLYSSQEILSINNIDVKTWLKSRYNHNERNTINLEVIDKSGLIKQIKIHTLFNQLPVSNEELLVILGVKIKIFYSLLGNSKLIYISIDSIIQAFWYVHFIINEHIKYLGKLFQKDEPLQIITPISLIKYIDSTLEQEKIKFFNLIVILSVSIGLLNILPIPGLDGGHLLYHILFLCYRLLNMMMKRINF